ncbi:MAG: hypothetical protein HYU60_03330 [Magnetospirillum sp.]|nr:hypothetical protein [Magnetospirillum sp.]
MILRFTRLLAALLAAPVLLSGCSLLQKKEPPPCPPIYILSDAATVTKYRAGAGRDLTDVEAEAEVLGYKGHCVYDEAGAELNLQISISAKRGPANASRKVDFSYFVAIPYFYPKPQAKAVFPISLEFPEGQNMAHYTDEEISMRIPVKDRELIDKFEIYIGFQTSPEELELNRRMKR